MHEQEFTVPRPAMCPNCGLAGDKHTGGPDERPPQPNDITMCFGCGMFLMFNDDMSLRFMKFADFKPLPSVQKFDLLIMKLQWLDLPDEVKDLYKDQAKEGQT